MLGRRVADPRRAVGRPSLIADSTDRSRPTANSRGRPREPVGQESTDPCRYGAHAMAMPFVTFDVALVQNGGGFRYQTW